ncbi:MAG: hypothetical protein AAFZ52_04835 [Bacteroidota bacterium]
MAEPAEEIPAPEAPATPRHRPDANVVIAIALAIISLCALIVSIYQTKILVAQQELAVKAEKAQLWPRVEANFGGFFMQGQYTRVYFTLENVGTGPAIIEDFSLRYQGQDCISWIDLYHRMVGEEKPLGDVTFVNLFPTDAVLQAGEELTIFRIEPNAPDTLLPVLQQFGQEGLIDVAFCYRSVFGDRWSVRGDLLADLVAREGCAKDAPKR